MSVEIKESILLIQKLVATESAIILFNEDKIRYKNHMENIFPTFAKEYPLLFKKIIFKEDLTMLAPMLKSIDDIVAGKNEKQITTKLGEDLAEKFLYPVLGKPPPKDE